MSTYHITNSTKADLDRIFELYEAATKFQQSFGNVVVWPSFDREMVLEEIDRLQQWKMMIDGQIACVWATTDSDLAIWGEKNDDPAIYIHRIATNPNFRGQGFVAKIVDWAKTYAQEQQKKFIRLDTMGENKGLINVYTKSGFTFLGMFDVPNRDQLPNHYAQGDVCLFEISL